MSILQRILDKVGGQVTEDYFRSQLLEELGSTNFNDDYADTADFRLANCIFSHILHKQNNHIMTCILYHM